MMASLRQSCFDIVKYIPLITPAIDKKEFRTELDLQHTRGWIILTVAFAALGYFVASAFMSSHKPLFAALLVASFSPLLLLLDRWRNTRAVNDYVVQHYLKETHPQSKALQRIANEPNAAQMVVNQHGDLNKKSANGSQLLDFCPDFKFFKLLADRGYDWSQIRTDDQTALSEVISWGKPDHLEYLLTQGKVKASQYTREQQVFCWMTVKDSKSAHLLVSHGFDINVTNDQGYSPLLLDAANRGGMMTLIYFLKRPKQIDHMKILLENGANPYQTLSDQGIQKNAFDLNTDTTIAGLLDSYKVTDRSLP